MLHLLYLDVKGGASEQERLVKEIELKLSLIKTESGSEIRGSPVKSADKTKLFPYEVAPPNALFWHKYFKTSGHIVESEQKDRLSFSSLAHQIEHKLGKGVPEMEIVDVVIQAITPGLQLHSYLEMKINLTLPRLWRILPCHYQEKKCHRIV